MCPPTILQQGPDLAAVATRGTVQHPLLSLPLVQQQLGSGAVIMHAGHLPAKGQTYVQALVQQPQFVLQQQQVITQQQAQQQAQAGLPQQVLLSRDPSASGAAHTSGLPAGHELALCAVTPYAGPILPVAAPMAAAGSAPAAQGPGLAELCSQLESVQAQVVAQQQYIRSLHKWAGSAAAAVRQLQDQSRAAAAPIKAYESELTQLRNQLSVLTSHVGEKDTKIEVLLQELSDVKAQLVEVERMASELAPREQKRRKLLSSESSYHRQQQQPSDGQQAAAVEGGGVPKPLTESQLDPALVREAASYEAAASDTEVAER